MKYDFLKCITLGSDKKLWYLGNNLTQSYVKIKKYLDSLESNKNLDTDTEVKYNEIASEEMKKFEKKANNYEYTFF